MGPAPLCDTHLAWVALPPLTACPHFMGEDDSDLVALPAARAGSPSAQSLAKPSLKEPEAGILHVRICAGGGEAFNAWPSLPQPPLTGT